MKPLNLVERNKAFWSFLLFFIITVSVIVIAMLFSFTVPIKDNEKLREQVEKSKAEMETMKLFEARMQLAMNLLDSVSYTDKSFLIDNKIDRQLKELAATIPDSSSFTGLYNKIMDNLSNIKVAKAQIRTHNSTNDEMSEKDKTISELKDQLDKCADRLMQRTQ